MCVNPAPLFWIAEVPDSMATSDSRPTKSKMNTKKKVVSSTNWDSPGKDGTMTIQRTGTNERVTIAAHSTIMIVILLSRDFSFWSTMGFSFFMLQFETLYLINYKTLMNSSYSRFDFLGIC